MSDDPSPSANGPGRPGWRRRLAKVLGTEPQDRETLIELLEGAQERGLYDTNALGMLHGVLEVSEMQVRDIMVPRPHMVVVQRDARPEELLPIIIESGHSRFPVIGEDRDEIIGILLAKDLLRYFSEGRDATFNIKDYLRLPVFIPESKRLNVLLSEFRDSQNHMAVVVDEYGGVSGLCTIEDVIEQIVGDIDDEHDIDEDEDISEDGEGRYLVRALTRIDEFNEYFKTDFEAADYDTVGGMIMHRLGRLPRRGESVLAGDLRFRVLRATRRRIDMLQVSKASRSPARDAAADDS